MSTPRQAVVTDSGAVLSAVVGHLEDAGVAVTVLDQGTTPEEAAEKSADSPVVIIGLMNFGANEIARLRSTALIIRAGIGYDVIDVDAATSAGIWVSNVPDFCVDEVADHTMVMLGAAMRRLPEAMGLWRQAQDWGVVGQLPQMHRMRGKRLGLIGLGRIGRQVAERARGFGWEVVAHDPLLDSDGEVGSVPLLDLDEVLATSHALSLHCPLTSETHHLVNQQTLTRMREGVVLVNTSRGGLVDLAALNEALSTGRVSVAALDVLDGEPRPDLKHAVLAQPNVIVTSHVAWLSSDATVELARGTADEALRFLNGENPRNLINPQARAL